MTTAALVFAALTPVVVALLLAIARAICAHRADEQERRECERRTR